jgi:hypothetical protein
MKTLPLDTSLLVKERFKEDRKMIVDLILDRKDDERDGIDSYNAREFYFGVMGYGEIGDDITRCMDEGEEWDVKMALMRYILRNGYNEKICDYICSVNWL